MQAITARPQALTTTRPFTAHRAPRSAVVVVRAARPEGQEASNSGPARLAAAIAALQFAVLPVAGTAFADEVARNPGYSSEVQGKIGSQEAPEPGSGSGAEYTQKGTPLPGAFSQLGDLGKGATDAGSIPGPFDTNAELMDSRTAGAKGAEQNTPLPQLPSPPSLPSLPNPFSGN